MMIRILHTADLHLGAAFATLEEGAAGRRADQLETFERIVNLALERDVHMVLVSGDLFDSPRPPASVVTAVQGGFQRLCRKGILPVLLPGGADASRSGDEVFPHGLGEGVLVLDPYRPECTTLEIEGQPVCLHTPGVADGRIAWPAEQTADAVHIGLCHLSGASARLLRIADAAQDEVFGEWQGAYLALGGLHQYREWRTGESLAACCPGTPEGLGFDESGPRYCVTVEIAPDAVALEKHAVNRRTYEQLSVDLTGCSTAEEIAGKIRDLGHPDRLARLTLSGQPALLPDAARLQKAAAACFGYLEIEDRTPLLGSPLAEKLGRCGGRYAALVRTAEARAARLPKAERPLLEAALREILLRCAALPGGLS